MQTRTPEIPAGFWSEIQTFCCPRTDGCVSVVWISYQVFIISEVLLSLTQRPAHYCVNIFNVIIILSGEVMP